MSCRKQSLSLVTLVKKFTVRFSELHCRNSLVGFLLMLTWLTLRISHACFVVCSHCATTLSEGMTMMELVYDLSKSSTSNLKDQVIGLCSRSRISSLLTTSLALCIAKKIVDTMLTRLFPDPGMRSLTTVTPMSLLPNRTFSLRENVLCPLLEVFITIGLVDFDQGRSVDGVVGDRLYAFENPAVPALPSLWTNEVSAREPCMCAKPLESALWMKSTSDRMISSWSSIKKAIDDPLSALSEYSSSPSLDDVTSMLGSKCIW